MSNNEFRMSKWCELNFSIPRSLFIIRHSPTTFVLNSRNGGVGVWRGEVLSVHPPTLLFLPTSRSLR